jgi:hypothetical protein
MYAEDFARAAGFIGMLIIEDAGEINRYVNRSGIKL